MCMVLSTNARTSTMAAQMDAGTHCDTKPRTTQKMCSPFQTVSTCRQCRRAGQLFSAEPSAEVKLSAAHTKTSEMLLPKVLVPHNTAVQTIKETSVARRGWRGRGRSLPIKDVPTICESGLTSKQKKVAASGNAANSDATTMEISVIPNSGRPHGAQGDSERRD